MSDYTNNEIIDSAITDLDRRRGAVTASHDFCAGYIAALGFMRDDYDEGDGSASDHIVVEWDKYLAERDEIDFQAKFKQMSTTDGTTKLVFEPSSRFASVLPSLLALNGATVCISINDPQLRLKIEKEKEPDDTDELPLEDGDEAATKESE